MKPLDFRKWITSTPLLKPRWKPQIWEGDRDFHGHGWADERAHRLPRQQARVLYQVEGEMGARTLQAGKRVDVPSGGEISAPPDTPHSPAPGQTRWGW